MFKSMRLKNFKAYKDSGEIPLAPLTVIIGANNSGKSTLFHALLALVQTARDTDQGWAPRLVTRGLVDLNGFHDIVHGDHTDHSTFEIDVTLAEYIFRSRKLIRSEGTTNGVPFTIPDRAQIEFGLDSRKKEIRVNRSTFLSGAKPAVSVHLRNGRWTLTTAPAHVPAHAGVAFRSIFPCMGAPTAEGATQAHLDQVAITRVWASEWAHAFANQIRRISPVRVRVPWYASVGARTTTEFGMGGENLIADLGSDERDERTNKTRLELVADWFASRKVLKSIHLLADSLNSFRMLLGGECKGPTNINIAAMGEGISQILPIIAYTLFGMDDDCMLVEQPEIHLHPALQSELGDLFLDVAKTGRRQLLVETHSEHLLLRIRRRIAEGTVNPDDVAILFVEKQHGEAKIRRLDVNSRGHFSDWPKGFFDEAYQEAMALAAAAARKG